MTTYKKQDGQWKYQNTYIGAIGFINKTDGSLSITCNNSVDTNLKSKILKESSNLNFISNGVFWYRGLSITNNVTFSKEEVLTEVFKDSKSGSWIWVEDSYSPKSKVITDNFSWLTDPKGKETAWKLTGCKQTYFEGSQELKLDDSAKIQVFLETIEKFETKGKWVDTEEVCAPYYSRNISNKQIEDLKLFCSAKQKSEEI